MTGLGNEYENSVSQLPPFLAGLLLSLPGDAKSRVQEIRLRINRPLSVFDGRESLFVQRDGTLSCLPGSNTVYVGKELLKDTYVRLCGYSVHTHEDELMGGFITTSRGDRVGVCAAAVTRADGKSSIRDITSVNMRVSRQKRGIAAELCGRVPIEKGGIIICGPPSSGKTTILRDAVRMLSSGGAGGRCVKVAVIDERYELSGAHGGEPTKDIGLCSDLICGMDKALAIEQAVRTLSPEIIATDEIGSEEEIRRISGGFACGVGFVVTAHCGSEEELGRSRIIAALMKTGAFGHIVLLAGPSEPSQIRTVMTDDDYFNKNFGLRDGLYVGARCGLCGG